ncbi:hypothetical protein SAMN05428944_7263 [Streptomyces sp. 1222.5]|uniref:hypothetical protein n=1 Tax=unclassified Streptomyces TaxID=2593676 RepID=UPI00089B45E1|nr:MULTISPECIES: hypothetical protein [unclassified Streptomyces]PKW05708.1 hypothetical protein BX260_0829 [Streptomyces sp. 5112.2]SED31065.1 hypothetical protein SAMN05428944_7263 [Streptomyces sp. 1222.5]
MRQQKATVMDMGKRRRSTRSGLTGRQLLVAQAAVVGSLVAALFVRELPGIMRELRIYRMTGGLRAGHRYP